MFYVETHIQSVFIGQKTKLLQKSRIKVQGKVGWIHISNTTYNQKIKYFEIFTISCKSMKARLTYHGYGIHKDEREYRPLPPEVNLVVKVPNSV